MKLMGYNSQMETTIDSLRSTAVLLVGFFARVRASVLAIVVASATAIGLAACGGGGGDGVGNVGNGNGGGGNGRGGVPNLMNPMAYFHGAERVEGLQYQYKDGSSGETDARGGFQFEQGKTVVFSIGEATTLGTVVVSSDAGRDFVTPSRIVGNSDEQAVRVERLLIALDENNEDGISIPEAALRTTTNLLGISGLDATMTMTSSPVVEGITMQIPTKADAQAALERTNNCAYSGSFAGQLSDRSAAALVLMPSIGGLTVADVVNLSTASPAISFTRDESDDVKIGEAFLTIDLKPPPLVATFELEGETTGTMTLASYDRIEFGGGTVFGTVRRVAGDPNADYRLVGVYDGGSDGDGAFVADIYRGGNAQISDISSPDFQDVLSGTHTGIGTAALTLQFGANSATLTLFADSNIFLGANGDIGGTWCEL